jgi:hypothetical protein
LLVCLGFETRRSLASNRVDPTQNKTHPAVSGSGVTLSLLQKRASFACPFLLINPSKSRGFLFDAYLQALLFRDGMVCFLSGKAQGRNKRRIAAGASLARGEG